MKHNILIISITLLFLAACQKNNPEPIPPITVKNYFPLAVGNYWIYERSECDSNWTNCLSKSIDTNIVTKDTSINGITYFKIEGVDVAGRRTSWYLRDSLDFIVDLNGIILLSNTDFENVLQEYYAIDDENDTLCFWYRQMQDEPNYVEVPAGSFECLDNKLFLYRKTDDFKREFNTHYYFSKNVGPVFESSMLVSNTLNFKRELIEYNLKP